MKYQYTKKTLDPLVAKTAVSLVRFLDLTSLDKPFLEAGQACQRIGMDEIAFVYLNRYIDIFYMIEDPSNNNIEEVEEFSITDIPSLFNLHLPRKNQVSEDEKKEISNWVLKKSVDNSGELVLPRVRCPSCSKDIFEACLTCPFCQNQFEPCILTGYPIHNKPSHSCRSCGRRSLQDMMEIYQINFTYCAWCGNPP